MKSKDLRRGALYAVKVSGAIVPVRLLAGYADDGTPAGSSPWTCQNIKTGRRVMVRGAARFRYELEPTSAEELTQTGREYKRKGEPWFDCCKARGAHRISCPKHGEPELAGLVRDVLELEELGLVELRGPVLESPYAEPNPIPAEYRG